MLVFFNQKFIFRIGRKSNKGELFERDLCTKLWCTKDGINAQTSFPAAMGSTCAIGKWCISGLCVKNDRLNAHTNTKSCLVPDEYEFCHKFTNKFGMHNTCSNYAKSRCCETCGASLLPRLSNHIINNWILKAKLKNVLLIDKPINVKCEDKYSWCLGTITKLSKKINGICKRLFLINNEVIQVICRKSCKLC